MVCKKPICWRYELQFFPSFLISSKVKETGIGDKVNETLGDHRNLRFMLECLDVLLAVSLFSI